MLAFNIWEVNGELLEDSGSDYDNNTLIVSEVQDEQEVRTLDFTNKSGQTILKRVQGDKNNWLDTYYVYDDLGNLIYVIPPQARKEIADGGITSVGPIPEDFIRLDANQTYNTTQSPAKIYYNPGVKVTLGSGFNFASTGGSQFKVVGGTLAEGLHYGLLFAYEYDSRQRLIAKKVPGAHWEYMVYDQWDRLVMTQNGNQRDSEEWSFIKYDANNRPVLSGLVTLPGVDLATIRANASTATGRYVIKETGPTFTQPWGYYLNRDNEVLANSNAVYPSISESDLLSVTYYDDYTYIDGWTALGFYDDNGPSESLYPSTYHSNVKGLVTGGATKLLDDSGDWLKSTTYYDLKYRVIQTQYDNIIGEVDRSTNTYNFAGNLIRNLQTHDPSPNLEISDIQVTRIMDYDHINRLLTIDHQIDDEPMVRMVTNRYNRLGELIEKNLHEDAEDNFRQSVDYRYNIRGWLTAINDPTLTAQPDDDMADLFGMKLNYDSDQSRLSFNGNISGMQWQTSVGGTQRNYGYIYDELNRIKMADFGAGTALPFQEVANHEMRVRDYDFNGNILDLERNGELTPGSFGSIDEMDYTYQGNQLISVADAGVDLGFKDGATATTEYYYDNNGNMIVDQNKGITGITYNHLNLPVTVTLNSSGGSADRIDYTYDASGSKLKQEVFVGGELKTTQYYAGAYIYVQEADEEKLLSFVQTEEGRLVPWRVTDAIAGYEYQYHMTDHLGNVRLTFAGNNVSEVTATMEDDDLWLKGFEEDAFRNIEITRQNNVAPGLNHSEITTLSPNPRNAAYLGTEEIGPAMTFSVNTGDKVAMTVFAKFEDQTSFSTTPLATLGEELGNTFVGLNGLETVTAAIDAFNGALAPLTFGTGSDQVPRAFLNYLLFDENNVLDKSGFLQIKESSGFAPGQAATVPFDEMFFDGGGGIRDITVDKKGYIYIYVSNETPGAKVWFDDLNVIHTENEVVQADDYYPFGLTMAATSYQGEDRLENDFTFQGKEHTKDLDWHQFYFRNYDATTGRWHAIDPYDQTVNPYVGIGNDPINLVDPDGGFFFKQAFLNYGTAAATGAIAGAIIDKDNGKRGAALGALAGIGIYGAATGFSGINFEGFNFDRFNFPGFGRAVAQNPAVFERVAMNVIDPNTPDPQGLPEPQLSPFPFLPRVVDSFLHFGGVQAPDDRFRIDGNISIVDVYNDGGQRVRDQFSANSGSRNLLPAPSGNFVVDNFRVRTVDEFNGGFFNNGVGFTFDVTPEGFLGTTNIRIHPDGLGPNGANVGTAGCIGLTCSGGRLESFSNSVRAHIRAAGSMRILIAPNRFNGVRYQRLGGVTPVVRP